MRLFHRRTRTAAALAAVAAVLPLGALAGTANAAPKRSADTTTYTSAKFLQQTLGLPNKDKLVIESVTYDRLQWLLRQEGKLAFIIGDPATDPTFAARAQDVESAADAAGVKRVYWFNPNLSGNAQLGDVTQPNLDIRDPDGITSLAPNSRTIYGHAWRNLIGRHLGNGVSVTQAAAANTGSARVTTALDATVVNDYGKTPGFSTKIGNVNGGALYDYSSGSAPADVKDSFFFIYDKDETVSGQPTKILAWVNLTKQPSAASALADITTAINQCGATSIRDISEFEWWKQASNLWQTTSSPGAHQGVDQPLLTDAAGAEANGGWRVHQITYPELVFLLKTEQEKDVAFLFGGTWCPNTRAVVSFVNKYAQENDVTVFNWDTILDGSVVGGGNAASNPLQSRNPAITGTGANTVRNANPSFIYGEVVARFLNNLKTEYKPDANNRITYWPGGVVPTDTSVDPVSQPRLQVPYLFGYKGQNTQQPFGGVNRQWIIDLGNGDYREYMTQWWLTNPQPNQLGRTETQLPRAAPIWQTLNQQLASFTWQTDPTTLYVNTATFTDAAQYLTPTEQGRVVSFSAPNTVTVSTAGSPLVDVNATALSAALTALGASAPANLADARTAYVAARQAATPDPALIANLEKVVIAWTLVDQRKGQVNGIWGNAQTPSNSVAGGIAAVRALQVFFEGLPAKPTPPAPPAPEQPAPPAGGDTPTPPAPLAPASPGAPTPITGGGGPGTTTATKARVGRVAGTVARRQTGKVRGRYTVRITTPRGRPTATGPVTITLRKGRTTRTVRGILNRGVATVTLPKLAKGTWRVTIAWAGNATYQRVSATGAPVKVTR